MTQWPNQLGGAHRLVGWLNRLRQSVKECEIKQFVGGRIIETRDGRILVADAPNFPANDFPFKIYTSGAYSAGTPTGWLKFKVSTGHVITTSDSFIPTGIDTEFTLTSGVAKYYFLMTLTPTTAVVSVSATAPTWAIDLIPIGWVDTNTYSASAPPVAFVHQFLKENVFSPCVV